MNGDELSEKEPLDSTGNIDENANEKEHEHTDVEKVDLSRNIKQHADKPLPSIKKSVHIETKPPAEKEMKIEVEKPCTIESDSQKVDKGDNVFKRFHKLSQKKEKVLQKFHKLPEKEEKAKSGKSGDSVTNIIVIAYTILLLVLGFIVYRDLTNRLHLLENRVSRAEALLTDKKNMTIDNIEIYDME